MVDLKNMNNNIISRRWKERYAELSEDKKNKIVRLDNSKPSEYQLQVIKRKRIYPDIGDLFMIKPNEELTLYGVVVNNHINNMNGEDLLMILIFKSDIDVVQCIKNGICYQDLLLPPQIVGKGYWTRGYFFNIDHVENMFIKDSIGFYHIIEGIFVDEYGRKIEKEPVMLGTYGVSTVYGIAMKINRELIIEGLV